MISSRTYLLLGVFVFVAVVLVAWAKMQDPQSLLNSIRSIAMNSTAADGSGEAPEPAASDPPEQIESHDLTDPTKLAEPTDAEKEALKNILLNELEVVPDSERPDAAIDTVTERPADQPRAVDTAESAPSAAPPRQESSELNDLASDLAAPTNIELGDIVLQGDGKTPSDAGNPPPDPGPPLALPEQGPTGVNRSADQVAPAPANDLTLDSTVANGAPSDRNSAWGKSRPPLVANRRDDSSADAGPRTGSSRSEPDLAGPNNIGSPSSAAPPQPTTSESPSEFSQVTHGRGAIELAVPQEWKVLETPFGREIRLVLFPRESTVNSPQKFNGRLDDGVWISCHLMSASRPKSDAELEAMLSRRLQLSVGEVQLRTPVRGIQLAGQGGVAVDYTTPSNDRMGRHLLVMTDWGVCEIHLASPPAQLPMRVQQFGQLMNTVRFGKYTPIIETPTQLTRDAEPALGVWKAYKNLLRLRGDGTITIENDRPANLDLQDSGAGPESAPRNTLTGQYEARDDLLLVKWDDGSLVNFRWRIDNDNLLLTDHQGQTSLLRRVAR